MKEKRFWLQQSWLRRVMRRWANGRLVRQNSQLQQQVASLERELKQTNDRYEVENGRLQFEIAALNQEIELMSSVIAREIQRVETETFLLAKRQREPQ